MSRAMLYRLIELWFRVTAMFRRRRLDHELQEELAFHLAMRESDYASAGYSRDEARHAAARRFGNRTRVQEELREMWTFPSVESVLQDVRYAIRTLLKAPGFTVAATVTLALGIGGTVTIYSLARAASIDSVPFRDADQLVQLWGTVQREQVERRGASYLDFLDWRAQATSFEDMAVFDGATATLSLTSAERLQIEAVSPSYFSMLGMQPVLGRTFAPAEDTPSGSERVAILSDGLWRRQFGGDRGIVGQSISLDGRPFLVVGVMSPGFHGLTDTAQLWIPFTYSQTPATLNSRGNRGFVALARLRPGATLAGAQAELDTISARLEQAYPATNDKRGVEVSSLDAELFGGLRPALRALTVAVALVLVMACANVANLLLARSETRQREIALRSAIGASRARLLRQLLTESCVLTGIAALAGVAVAEGSLRALVASSPVRLPSFAQPSIDSSTMLVAIAVAVLCGIALGFAPAAHTRVSGLADALKDSVRGTSSGRRAGRVRGALIVAELTLAVVLLVGAGLMIRSVSNLVAVEPGFDAASILTFRVSIPAPPPADGTPVAAAVVGNRALLDRVRAVSGVSAVSLASDIPLEGSSSAVFYAAEGQTEMTVENRPRAYFHRVSPDFFETVRIPMLAGRSFVDTEVVPDTPVVIVSERLARRFWPDGDALGKRIKLGDLQSDGPWRRIIGIVGDVKYRGLPDNPTADPDIYFPMLDAVRQVALVVRTTLPPSAIAAPIRSAIQEWNSAVPVYNVQSMQELVGAQTAESRFTTWLMGTFAALALVLAAVGLYGVMSYVVTQRTREIGIRLALGASTREVLTLVLGSGLRLIAVGLVLGTIGAGLLRELLAAQLFQVATLDSAAFAAVALLAATGLLACTIPAIRAARLQAVVALHQE